MADAPGFFMHAEGEVSGRDGASGAPTEGPVRPNYRAAATDLRDCDGCDQLAAPFPMRASRYCAACAMRLLATPLDGLLTLTLATLAEYRRLLVQVAPNALAAIDATARTQMERLGAPGASR